MQLSATRVSTLVDSGQALVSYVPLMDTMQVSALRAATLVQAPASLGGYAPLQDIVQLSSIRVASAIALTNDVVQGTQDSGPVISYLSSPLIG